MSEPLADGQLPSAPKPSVEAKVKTSAAAAVFPALLYGLFSNPDLKAAVTAASIAVVSAGAAYVTGWLTKHTPRAE